MIPVEVMEFLSRLPADDRRRLLPVFRAIHHAMPEGFILRLHLGMPCWVLDSIETTILANVAVNVKGRGLVYLFGLARDPHRWAMFRQRCSLPERPMDINGCRVGFVTADDLDLSALTHSIANLDAAAFINLCKPSARELATQ